MLEQDKTLGFEYAAIGILFSVEKYSKNINQESLEMFEEFFTDLKLEEDNPTTSINFSRLMVLIDWSHRWIYKGSLTFPPCHQFVYWNIIYTVYPID